MEKLEETYHCIENLEKLSCSLTNRLSRAKKEKITQEGFQSMLRFDLIQMQSEIADLKEQLSQLESEEERYKKSYLDTMSLIKHFKSIESVNRQREELKDNSIQKLRNNLMSMDFSIEAQESDIPSSHGISQCIRF